MQVSTLRESPLVTMADAGRRVTPWWLAYVVFLVGGLGVITVGGGFALQTILNLPPGSFLGHATELLVFGAQALLITAWIRWYEGRGFRTLGFPGGRGPSRFGIGLAIGVGISGVIAAGLVLLGGYTFTASAPDPGLGVPAIVLVAASLLIVVVQASTEELTFRGFILQANARTLPGIGALLLPAIVFTLSHGFSQPIAIATVILFAVFAALVALRDGSLFLVAGIHTGWNWSIDNVLGSPVSGEGAKQAALFTLAPRPGADPLVSGGTFGLENSLVGLVAWAILALIAYRAFRSPSR